MLIPVPSTLAFTPQAYYISLHTLFPIATHLYLLARRATTTAPSVSDVVSKGSHVLCAANRVCMGVASALQPVTAYDVYYWFVSEAGAEPTAAITTMMRRVQTLAVVPFALTVEGVGAEPQHLNVRVSMEGRGGRVWCRVHETDFVPTVEQLKRTTPAELRDGATSAVKRIDDLAADTAYFGYCYAEDAYGDRMSNSVESTRFAVTTRAEALWWNATLAANSTTAAVEAASNRALTFCCVLRRDEEPVAFDDVMNGGLCVAVPALQPTTLFSGVEDNTQYWVTCAARTASFEELLFDAPAPLLTAARAPILALEAVRPTYHSLEVTLRSDRPGHAWCLALSEAESTASRVPSVEAIKEGAAGTLVADGLADVYVEGLAAETLYQVWCYAETAEGLPMQNTLQSLHVAQRTFPCGLR